MNGLDSLRTSVFPGCSAKLAKAIKLDAVGRQIESNLTAGSLFLGGTARRPGIKSPSGPQPCPPPPKFMD